MDRRRRVTAALAWLRALPGTLLVVPAVVLLWGSQWTVERRHEPASARLERPGEPAAGRTLPTYLVPEGAQLEQGVLLEPGEALTFELPRVRGAFELELQAFYRDAYTVSVSADGEAWEPLWEVGATGGRGMRTRQQRFEAPEQAISHLRVEPRGTRAGQRFSGLRVTWDLAVIRHGWLVVVFWGLGLAVALARLTRALRPAVERLLAGWRRADPWLATLLVALVLFRLTPELVAGAVGVALIGGAVALFSRHFARAPLATLLYVAFLYALFFLFLPWAVSKVAAARAGALYDLTVDHRMRPDGDEINSDGLRFRGEAGDLEEADFVVLALGDSFTYGLKLAYEESYPYVLERLLADRECSAEVRVVNFGWASSSPLLSLRLLEQVGARYKPDLVLYNLDMTDFADDLRYESELRAAGDLEIDHTKVFRDLVLAVSSRLPARGSAAETFERLLRRHDQETDPDDGVPADRFFVTSRSLERTRPEIERGVMKNLERLHAYAASQLGVPMALIVYPRAYQYSAVESPNNWERSRYERLGPFVREPFRYFDEVAATLPYLVESLLPAFESAREHPLFFDDDPHWTPAGARLAAEAVERFLLGSRLVPCTPPAPPGGAS